MKGTSTSSPSLSLQHISRTRSVTCGGIGFFDTTCTASDTLQQMREERKLRYRTEEREKRDREKWWKRGEGVRGREGWGKGKREKGVREEREWREAVGEGREGTEETEGNRSIERGGNSIAVQQPLSNCASQFLYYITHGKNVPSMHLTYKCLKRFREWSCYICWHWSNGTIRFCFVSHRSGNTVNVRPL